MSLPEIIAIAIPIGIIALVWLPFESAILKVFKMGGSPRNKGGTQKKLTKEYSTDRIDPNLKTGEKKVELKPALQKTQSVVKDNKDIEPDTEKEEHMIEEEFYELAYKEIESGNLKKGLWAKAFSETEGDENKTKALYIKYRFEQIKESHKEIDEKEEEVEIDSNLIPEKKIIETKIESHDEFANRHKGQSKLSREDIDRTQTEANIKLRKAINYSEPRETIEPKRESHDELIKRLKGQPGKESQEDIDRKQAEAYIRLHEAINYWE